MEIKKTLKIPLFLVLLLPSLVLGEGKPEVIINPIGLDSKTLTAVDKAVSAIVRQADDQDASEAARIRRKGRQAIVNALATRGYFDPEVILEVGEDIGGETWEVSIDPKEASKVTLVDNRFQGQITNQKYAARVDRIKDDWSLPKDKTFINSSWSSAKSSLLGAVKEEDFFLARMNFSQALVDPEESSVELSTEVDSGPAVSLGHTEVIGLRRVPMSLIHRYIQYAPGQRYTQDQLDEWQAALQSTNFFRGAFVNLKDPDSEAVYSQDEVTLPVQVRVTEGAARIFQGAVGIDDVNYFKVEGTYKQNVVFNYPITLSTGASLGFKEQRGFLDFDLPPNEDGSVDSYGMMVRHSDIEHEEVWRAGIGWRRKKEFKLDPDSRVDWETNWSLIGAVDRVKRRGQPVYNLPSVVGTWDLMRRDVDDKFDPREGNLVVLGLGAGVDVKYGDPFARADIRSQIWWPVGRRDNFSLKAHVGKVFSKPNTRFPDDFGYRTGGANSVRGYKYMGLGKQVYRSTVGTRALAVMSAEYTHYFDDLIGMAAFVDVGDAAESFGKLKPHWGIGTGARVKTPAGPLFLDVAWGAQDRKLRLHFSLGIAF